MSKTRVGDGNITNNFHFNDIKGIPLQLSTSRGTSSNPVLHRQQ